LAFMRYLSLGQQKILFVLALFILIILYFQFYYYPFRSPPEENVREVVVEVLGEVRNPGIQIFHHLPTLKESIEKAGGLKDVAFFDMNSSSEALETGTLLTIVKESQDQIKAKLGRMGARKLLVFSISLDLNRVSLEDLLLIPGIGESLGREIMTYRERRKGFQSVDELKNVKGIGEKKWKALKTFLTVRSD
jgi:competence protein ComEA